VIRHFDDLWTSCPQGTEGVANNGSTHNGDRVQNEKTAPTRLAGTFNIAYSLTMPA